VSQLDLDLIAVSDEADARLRAAPSSGTAQERTNIKQEEAQPPGVSPSQTAEPRVAVEGNGTGSATAPAPIAEVPDEDRRRVALAHLLRAKERLGDPRAQRSFDAHIKVRAATPLPDAAFACVAVIPQDVEELRSRPCAYRAAIDVLETALTGRPGLRTEELAQLQDVLSSRPLVDLAEDLIRGRPSEIAKQRSLLPAEQQHLSRLLIRLALRARSMTTDSVVVRTTCRGLSPDLVKTLLHEARYRLWHESTGLLGTASTLHPAEITSYVPVILRDANEGNVGALICIVAFSLGKMPRHFAAIGLRAGGPFTAFLTDEFAVFNWRGRVLHPTAPHPEPGIHLPTSDQFSAAIPLEVTQLLRGRPTAAQANSLHELVGPGEDLTALASAYLQKFNAAPRTVTLERISNTLPRLVAQCAVDNTVGAAAYCDLTLANKAKFHSLLVRGTAVQSACSEAFIRSGFSGATAVALTADMAINPHLNDATIAKAANELIEAIVKEYRSCGPRSRWRRLREGHERLALAVAGLFQLLTGHRPKKRVCVSMRRLCLAQRIALVADKKCSPYEARRVIALPEVVVESLDLYMDWLQRLCKLKSVPTKIRNAIAARLKLSADASLFSCLSENALEPLTGKRVARRLAQVGVLRGNEGRRVVERLAREGRASRPAVDAQLGHTPAGAETFASYSALRPCDVVMQVKTAMDRRLRELGVSSPREARVRKSDSPERS
jgi:hypothetical protein